MFSIYHRCVKKKLPFFSEAKFKSCQFAFRANPSVGFSVQVTQQVEEQGFSAKRLEHSWLIKRVCSKSMHIAYCAYFYYDLFQAHISCVEGKPFVQHLAFPSIFFANCTIKQKSTRNIFTP